ncbi:MAG: RNA polymerase sigma factor [Planctomycetota bacterium]|jgi:RNA polymerase sigma-70 factor (ECF subfamily)
MRQYDQTSIGGEAGAFLTTHWSLIEKTRTNEEANRALIGLLLNKYGKPVYCYLRRKGYDNEQAKDLTQGFFHEVVLGRGLIQKADQSRGRFRSYLLLALNRYIINVREEETAQKRIPLDRLVSLDMIDPPDLPSSVIESAPEEAFNYAWVSALLEQALDEVQAKCNERNLTLHWQVFCDRIVRPILNRAEPLSMKAICDRYGIDDAVKASNMMTTVKRLFQTILRQHVRHSVMSEEDTADEFTQIKRFFPKKSAE